MSQTQPVSAKVLLEGFSKLGFPFEQFEYEFLRITSSVFDSPLHILSKEQVKLFVECCQGQISSVLKQLANKVFINQCKLSDLKHSYLLAAATEYFQIDGIFVSQIYVPLQLAEEALTVLKNIPYCIVRSPHVDNLMLYEAYISLFYRDSVESSPLDGASVEIEDAGLKLEVGDLNCELERLSILQCVVDDRTPEILALVIRDCLALGAVDAFAYAVHMKKGRIGQQLNILVSKDIEKALIDFLFHNTGTFGLRKSSVVRHKLKSSHTRIHYNDVEIRVRLGHSADELVAWKPEIDDVRRYSELKGISVVKAYDMIRCYINESGILK
ncbi:MAG: DUF111 family protein [Candidatus Cloacimonetes bacterium]|nr:DUF111 family protein [Candidatus Cloacimonadota bacterium]